VNIDQIIESFTGAFAEQKFPRLRVMIIGDETKNTLEAMREVKKILVAAEVHCWAMSDLLPGVDRKLYLSEGCEEATLVMIFVSKKIEEEGGHIRFINKAFDAKDGKPRGQVYIIPVVIEDCQVPRYLFELQPLTTKSVREIQRLLPIFAQKLKSQKTLSNPKVDWSSK
jgi:hypothetical protein